MTPRRGNVVTRNATKPHVAWWTALAGLSVALLAPLLIANVPPVLDYPNHLARLALVAAGPHDRVLGRMFTPHWGIIPNLAGDLIGMTLLRLMPVHVVGRCLLGGVLLLNLAGVLALHRAWFGRRSFWPLGSCVVAYNSGFLLGFLSWQIGSGLAMLFAAGWLSWRERRPVPTIAGAAIGSIVLFFCHLMALMFFLMLIVSAELYTMRRLRAVFIHSVGLMVVLIGPVLLSAFTALRDTPAMALWPTATVKLVNAAAPFINYVFPLDMISAVLVYGGITLGVATGWLVLAPRAVVAAAVLPIAYFLLPFDLMSASFLDMRVAVMFGFLAFAAVDSARQSSGRHQLVYRAAAVGCGLLFAARMAVVADVWLDYRRDLAELRAVIAPIPPGANVCFTNVPQSEAPAYWDAGPRARRLSNGLRVDYHLPAFLLIERRAFWPELFANPAQQPVQLRPTYVRLAREAHDLPSHAGLVANPDSAWPVLRDFDFVLMLEAGADPDLSSFLPRCLALVSRSDFAALFRILRDASGCAPARPTGRTATTGPDG
jgi:hypothetical protein